MEDVTTAVPERKRRNGGGLICNRSVDLVGSKFLRICESFIKPLLRVKPQSTESS